MLEWYVARQRASVLAVLAAEAGEVEIALFDYLNWRKLLLPEAHRTFGASGLGMVQAEYAAPAHWAILALIRTRLADPSSFLLSDPRAAAELAFMADNPEDFVPCRARMPT